MSLSSALLQGMFGALRMQPEERLRLLDLAVVHANDAILIAEGMPLDPSGLRIIYCNAAFTRMTGYEEAEILGMSPCQLHGPETDRDALDRVRAALDAARPIKLELLNYRKDGSPFWVEFSLVPAWNEAHQLTHWILIQRDVTKQKADEETIIQARVLKAEIEERKRVEAQLVHTAFYDDLTRLHNRAFLMDRLRSLLAQAKSRPDAGFSLLFLDLDRFKTVNDSLGHCLGDELLQTVARRIEGCIRPQDTMARIGGDEFAIIIDDTRAGVARQVAERILDALKPRLQLSSYELYSSCSIGILEASERYAEAEDMLRDADLAMYQVKKRGGRGWAVFTPSMRAAAISTQRLQMELRRALERDELRVHYQALMRPGAGIAGFEALVRWQHPQHGLVLPALFIPAAEEIGLMRQIGLWMLCRACAQLQAWQVRHPNRALRLSVNVSDRELEDPLFIQSLQEVLYATALPAHLLQLEIAESALLTHPETIVGLLERIRAIGVRIALDDFGTGYFSLSYLDRCPLDTIKIDQSFVSALPAQKRTLAIVETIVKLGRALDLEVVAEGVETAEQLNVVNALGCDYVQGYYFARPLPAAEAEALLETAGN